MWTPLPDCVCLRELAPGGSTFRASMLRPTSEISLRVRSLRKHKGDWLASCSLESWEMEDEMKKTVISFFAMFVGALMGCSNDTSQTAATTTTTYYLSNGTCYASTGAAVASSYCGVTTTGTYYWSNGLCYSSATGATVATNYCSTTSSNGYYTINGYCYAYATGQIVNSTYCSTTSTTGSTCVGYYYYLGNGYPQAVYCNGTNCRGYTMYTQAGQAVSCQ